MISQAGVQVNHPDPNRTYHLECGVDEYIPASIVGPSAMQAFRLTPRWGRLEPTRQGISNMIQILTHITLLGPATPSL